MAKRSLLGQDQQQQPEQSTAMAKMFNPGPVAPVAPIGPRCPYVAFHHPLSPKAAIIAAKIPNVAEGDAILHGADDPMRLDPFTFFLLRHFEYWGQFSQSGELLDAKLTAQSRPYARCIDAAIVAVLPNGRGLVAATCRFKSTKVDPAIIAVNELVACQTPEWVSRHPQAAAMEPVFRFAVQTRGKVVISKSTGARLICAEGIVCPTNTDVHNVVRTWLAVPGNMDKCQEAINAFESRKHEVQGKVK